MKLIKHRKMDDGRFVLEVHTDNSKVVDNSHPLVQGDVLNAGDPDPDYVRSFEWAPKPNGMTQVAYVEMMRREAKLLIEHEQAQEAAQKRTGTLVAGEGTDL